MRTDDSFTTIADSTEAETATEASHGMDFSFVEVPNNNAKNASFPTLQVTTHPKHDIIGLMSDLTHTQVCVNMKARELPDDDSQRAPIDIIVALDVSGSMSGGKLELCKKTLLLLLRVLFPDDRFGLICFDTDVTIEIPVQKMSEANKARCVEKVNALRTRGSTNMSGAVGLASHEMRQIENPNEVQAVFFLTDGHANVGISKPDAILEFTKNCFVHDGLALQGTEGAEDQPVAQARNLFRRQGQLKNDQYDFKPAAVPMEVEKPRTPITLHCFGYGSDHDSDLLRAMSDVIPGGSYYFVEDDLNVGTAFGDALGGVMSVVAQNVTVTLTVPPEAKANGVKILEVHYDNVVKRENGSFTCVVGDFYAEESRDVLFEVKLANSAGIQDPIRHVNVAVSYTDTLSRAPANANPTTCLIARPLGTEKSQPNSHVEVQLERLNATKAMKQANEFAMARNYSAATATLRMAKGRVQMARASAPTAYHDTLKSLECDFGELEGAFSSASVYEKQGKQKHSNIHYTHRTQRAMRSSAASSLKGSAGNAYASKKKMSMMGKFATK